jgi:hypothetical protein
MQGHSTTVGAVRPDALPDGWVEVDVDELSTEDVGTLLDTVEEAAEPDPDARYGITQAGRDAWRRWEAERNTFGPWPTLSAVLAAEETPS